MADDPQALLGRLTQEHAARHKRLQTNYRERTRALLVELLPDLEAASLAKLSRAGFAFAASLRREIDSERKQSGDELASLEERLQSDDLGPSGVAGELEKLQGHFEALQPFLKRCFGHPRFDDLLLDGYGTGKYAKRFWHLSYHLDRRAAKEVEDLCDGRTFANIRLEAVQALEASTVLKERLRSLRERKQGLAAAQSRRQILQERLANHGQVWLASARRRLADQLEADPNGAFERCRPLCEEELFAWRLAGELCKEHWSLEARFLEPAREAQEQGKRGTCQRLLAEYEKLAQSFQRFDQPGSPREAIDWKALIYKDAEPNS